MTAARLLLAAALLAAAPAAAQEPPAPPPPPEERLEDSARAAVEALIARLGAMIEALGRFAEDLPAYEAPRMLPNGDILIPRRRDPPPEAPATPDAPETLDL